MSRVSSPLSSAMGGLGYIILAAVVLALGDGLIKIVSNDVSVWQLIFLRSLIAVPMLGVFLLTRGSRATRRIRRPGWLIVRSVLLVTMWLLVYFALTTLSLPSVSAALYSAPVMITLLSWLSPTRRLAYGEFGAVALGFIGVLVLLRPGTSAFSPMLILPLIGAMFYALAAILTGSYCRHESPLMMAFGVHGVFLIVGLTGLMIPMAIDIPETWQNNAPFLAPGWHRVSVDRFADLGLIVVGLAVIAIVASAAMGRAYQMAPAPLIAAGDYSYLLFSVFWSVMLFGQIPTTWAFVGMLLITAAGVWATRSQNVPDPVEIPADDTRIRDDSRQASLRRRQSLNGSSRQRSTEDLQGADHE